MPNEYDGTDLVGTQTNFPPIWPIGNFITNLFVTWDASNLYVAVQGRETGNKFGVFIDVDPDNGTGATRTRDLEDPTGSKGFPDWLRYQSPNWEDATNAPPFGLDYLVASEGFYNNIIRIGYDDFETNAATILASVDNLFDSGNGSTPQGTPVDMVVNEDSSICFLGGLEAKIPWTTLYNDAKYGTVLGGDLVPVGATIRVMGHLWNNNTDAYSSEQTIPDQTSPDASYTGGSTGLVITADYLDVSIDADNDGLPDVAPGDVNAPFIKSASGAEGLPTVYLTYNEDLANNAALTDPLNYTIDGVAATSVTVFASNVVQVTASSDLPVQGSVLSVISINIEDLSGNSKTSETCLTVSAPGILNPVDVTFVLETDSGMGTGLEYFVNAAAFPLEEGLPPATNAPLSLVSGTIYSRTVTFPAGTPSPLEFRHSALLPSGTNNYEVVTMDKYDTAGHLLDLNDFGDPITVTNWLGTAGPPLRTGGPGTDGWIDVFQDPKRGDSGVRTDTPILFRLALTGRNLTGLDRVLVLGTDPLRGFNVNFETPEPVSDFPPYINPFPFFWEDAGIELFDDGVNGDAVAGDGIYSRLWAATTDGQDSTLVTGSPNSLVGGEGDFFGGDLPYQGNAFWTDARSPRRITYQFFVPTSSTTAYQQVSGDNILYIDSGEDGTTNDTGLFIWNNALPPLSSGTDPALILDVTHLTNPHTRVVFQNSLASQANNVEVGDLDTDTWNNYGQSGEGGTLTGIWTADVEIVSNDTEAYRIVTPGITNNVPQTKGLWTWWEPSFLDTNGGTVTVHYNQIGRVLVGDQTVNWFGALPDSEPFGSEAMTFEGNGQWSVDIAYGPTNLDENAQIGGFKLTDGDPPNVCDGDQGFGDNNYRIQWESYVKVMPDPMIRGGNVTITYDTTGSNIDGGTNVNLWGGWVEGETGDWIPGLQGVPMTNAGVTNVWAITLPVPTNENLRSLNFVFNNTGPGGTTWSSANDGPDNPFDWKAFVKP